MGERLPEPMQAVAGLEVADIHSGDGDETVLVGMVADSHYRQWLGHNLLVGVEPLRYLQILRRGKWKGFWMPFVKHLR